MVRGGFGIVCGGSRLVRGGSGLVRGGSGLVRGGSGMVQGGFGMEGIFASIGNHCRMSIVDVWSHPWAIMETNTTE